jgi:protein associated with RNAse G/E
VERDAQLVRVEYLKYDGSPHRSYPAIRLGSDGYGTWLGVPGGEFIAAAADEFKYAEPYVLLVPEHAWWTAMFNPPPRRTEVYCDVTTPATWAEGRMSLVDLDLDVRRRRQSGAVEIVDTEEFELHKHRYGYPPEVVAAALAAAAWLREALSGGAEPFAGGYKVWLDQVTGGFADPG